MIRSAVGAIVDILPSPPSRSLWYVAYILHSKNKQHNTFCWDLFVCLFVFMVRDKTTVTHAENNIPSLRSQPRDIAQHPEIPAASQEVHV